MAVTFFQELGNPVSDKDLGMDCGSNALQAANAVWRFDPVLDEVKPFAVLLVGDVDSTIVCRNRGRIPEYWDGKAAFPVLSMKLCVAISRQGKR